MSTPSGIATEPEREYPFGTAMTLEEWGSLPGDVEGELVDGRLTEEEVSDFANEVAVSWLVFQFRTWLRGRGGFVATSDAKFAVGPRRGRKPDVSVYLPEGKVPPARGVVRVPPDIAVEVVSPSPRDERRDRVEKMDDYAAFGIRFYWLLDPALGSLEIFELGRDRRYTKVLAATSGVLDAITGCPGLVLNLDELWAELHRLGPPSNDDR
jgi:Uma2 family endonuclease